MLSCAKVKNYLRKEKKFKKTIIYNCNRSVNMKFERYIPKLVFQDIVKWYKHFYFSFLNHSL